MAFDPRWTLVGTVVHNLFTIGAIESRWTIANVFDDFETVDQSDLSVAISVVLAGIWSALVIERLAMAAFESARTRAFVIESVWVHLTLGSIEANAAVTRSLFLVTFTAFESDWTNALMNTACLIAKANSLATDAFTGAWVNDLFAKFT